MHKNQTELLAKAIPFLSNIKEGVNTISFFCPFCQSSGIKTNGSKWYPSERKGYILKNEKSDYEYYMFYCHNSICESKQLSGSIKGGLSLESFADYVLRFQNPQIHQGATPPCNRSAEPVNQNQCSTFKTGSGCGSSKFQVLPRADRQHMAGQGGYIENKLKQRREARKSYWERLL